MIRKQIYLRAEDNARLKQIAQQEHKSEAEVIREALAHRLQEEEDQARAWEELKAWLLTLPTAETAARFHREDAYRDRVEPDAHHH